MVATSALDPETIGMSTLQLCKTGTWRDEYDHRVTYEMGLPEVADRIIFMADGEVLVDTWQMSMTFFWQSKRTRCA